MEYKFQKTGCETVTCRIPACRVARVGAHSTRDHRGWPIFAPRREMHTSQDREGSDIIQNH